MTIEPSSLPPNPADLPARRAGEALDRLAAAETYAEARDHWADFLEFWRKALNKCDRAGRRHRRATYVASDKLVGQSPELAYLWTARNAEFHGLDEIVERQESAIAIGLFGDFDIEPGEPDTDGRCVTYFIPKSPDPGPLVTLHPEHVKLQAVRADRGTIVAVPPGLDYDIGPQLAPVVLGHVGLDFLRSMMRAAFG